MYIKEKDFKLSLLFPRNSSWYFNYYIIVKSLHCCVQMILIILSTLFNFAQQQDVEMSTLDAIAQDCNFICSWLYAMQCHARSIENNVMKMQYILKCITLMSRMLPYNTV